MAFVSASQSLSRPEMVATLSWNHRKTASSASPRPLPLPHRRCRGNASTKLASSFSTSRAGELTRVKFGNIKKSFRAKRRLSLSFEISCSFKKEATVLQASTMEEIYDTLASRLLSAAAAMNDPGPKYLVGLAGPPGAGKSTVANEVVDRVNALWRQYKLSNGFEGESDLGDVAVSVPMDGFHLYRSQLDAMEDPALAHARRGAPWTFDASNLVNNLNSLQNQGWAYFPSFDHGVGDPIEEDLFVSSLHKVVLVEGNYLLLPDGSWRDLASIFDEKWFLDIDIDKTMKRVEKRHILTGKTPEEAKQRVDYNDRPNAELIASSKVHADLVIQSVDISV